MYHVQAKSIHILTLICLVLSSNPIRAQVPSSDAVPTQQQSASAPSGQVTTPATAPKPEIITAAENDDLQGVRSLLSDGAQAHQIWQGQTPLAWASVNGNVEKYLSYCPCKLFGSWCDPGKKWAWSVLVLCKDSGFENRCLDKNVSHLDL